jgi:surfeit locus 1 family protein
MQFQVNSRRLGEQRCSILSSMTTKQEPTESKQKSRLLPLAQLPRMFVSRRWWWTTLLVLIGMGVTIRLGIWQLDRLQQRRARNTEFVAQINTAPLELDGWYLPNAAEDLQDRPARAEGSFDFSQQIVLVQQNYEGRPGVHLVAPFVVGDGDAAVLVDRGWIPAHEVESGDLGPFNDAGQYTVAGSLQQSQILSRGRETIVDGPQEEWYRIDIDAIQQQVPYRLLPVYLLEEPPAEIQEQLPYRVIADIDLTEGPHLGYAIQWFLFCLILVVGYAQFVRMRSGK